MVNMDKANKLSKLEPPATSLKLQEWKYFAFLKRFCQKYSHCQQKISLEAILSIA